MAKKIRFVLGDQGPSGYFRISLPCATLKAGSDDVDLAFKYEDFQEADVLVFQRQHRHEAVEEILKWRRLGKKIIVDFDDNFLQLDPGNKANLVYTPEIIDDLKRLILSADVVTVAAEPLAELYSDFCRQIFVIPNALPAHAFDVKSRPSAKIIVGWQGSDSHFNDLKLIKSALTSLKRKFDFELVLAGYSPPGLFKSAVFRPWVKFSPDLKYYQSFADFTIGICPLAKSRFNDCKSDLKWLEYSSLAIPTVASDARPYADIQPESTGLLARNLAGWEEQIARLLRDASLRFQIGKTAKEHVLANRTITQNIQRWRQVLAAV